MDALFSFQQNEVLLDFFTAPTSIQVFFFLVSFHRSDSLSIGAYTDQVIKRHFWLKKCLIVVRFFKWPLVEAVLFAVALFVFDKYCLSNFISFVRCDEWFIHLCGQHEVSLMATNRFSLRFGRRFVKCIHLFDFLVNSGVCSSLNWIFSGPINRFAF